MGDGTFLDAFGGRRGANGVKVKYLTTKEQRGILILEWLINGSAVIRMVMEMRELTEREYYVLQVIDRYRILWALDIAWLCGFTDESYCRKVLMRLIRFGFVQTTKDWNNHNCYYLTATGIREIGKSSREYEVSYTTNHSLLCGRAASWLHAVNGVDAMDMLTDTELKMILRNADHRPDLVMGDTAYEIELNHKSLDRLQTNMLSNEKLFGHQIWLVPDNKQYIRNNLLKVADSVACDITVIPWHDIEVHLSNCDMKNNRRRFYNVG